MSDQRPEMARRWFIACLAILTGLVVPGAPAICLAQNEGNSPQREVGGVVFLEVQPDAVQEIERSFGPLRSMGLAPVQRLLQQALVLSNPASIETVHYTVVSVSGSMLEGNGEVRATLHGGRGTVILPLPVGGCVHDLRVDEIAVQPIAVRNDAVVLPLEGRGPHKVTFRWHLVATAVEGLLRLSWPWRNASVVWRLPANLSPRGVRGGVIRPTEDGWEVALEAGTDSFVVQISDAPPTENLPRLFGVLEEAVHYSSPGSARMDVRFATAGGVGLEGQPVVLRIRLRPGWRAEHVDVQGGGSLLTTSGSRIEVRVAEHEDSLPLTVSLTAVSDGEAAVTLPAVDVLGPVEVTHSTELVAPSWLVPVPVTPLPEQVTLTRTTAPSPVWRFAWGDVSEPVRFDLVPARAPQAVAVSSDLRIGSPTTCDTVLTVRPRGRLSLLAIRLPVGWRIATGRIPTETSPPLLRQLGGEQNIWLLWLPRPAVGDAELQIALRLEYASPPSGRLPLPCIGVEGAILSGGEINVRAPENTALRLAGTSGLSLAQSSSDAGSGALRVRYVAGASGTLLLMPAARPAGAVLHTDVSLGIDWARVTTRLELPRTLLSENLRLRWPDQENVPEVFSLPPGVHVESSAGQITLSSSVAPVSSESVRIEFSRRYATHESLTIAFPILEGVSGVSPTVAVSRASPLIGFEPVQLVPTPPRVPPDPGTEVFEFRYAGSTPALVVQNQSSGQDDIAVRSAAVLYRVTRQEVVGHFRYHLLAARAADVDFFVDAGGAQTEVLAASPSPEILADRLRIRVGTGETTVALDIRAVLRSSASPPSLPRVQVRGPTGPPLVVEPQWCGIQTATGEMTLLNGAPADTAALALRGGEWPSRFLLLPRLLAALLGSKETVRWPPSGVELNGGTFGELLAALEDAGGRRLVVDRFALACSGLEPGTTVKVTTGTSVEQLFRRLRLAAYVAPEYVLITTAKETYPIFGISTGRDDRVVQALLNPLVRLACDEAARRGRDTSGRFMGLAAWGVTGRHAAALLASEYWTPGTAILCLDPDAYDRTMPVRVLPAAPVRRAFGVITVVLVILGALLGRLITTWRRRLAVTFLFAGLIAAITFVPLWGAALLSWSTFFLAGGILVGQVWSGRRREIDTWSVTSTVTVKRLSSRGAVGLLIATGFVLYGGTAAAQVGQQPLVFVRVSGEPDKVLIPDETLKKLRQLVASQVVYPEAELRLRRDGSKVGARVRLSIDVPGDEPVRVPLPLSNWAPVKIALDDAIPQVERVDGRPLLRCPPGRHTLTIEAIQLLKEQPVPGVWSIALEWLPALQTRVTLESASRRTGAVFVKPALCAPSVDRSNATIEGHLGVTDRIEVFWVDEVAFARVPVEATCNELIYATGRAVYRVLQLRLSRDSQEQAVWRLGNLEQWELVGASVPVSATDSSLAVLVGLAPRDSRTVEIVLRSRDRQSPLTVGPLPTTSGLVVHWQYLVLAQEESAPPVIAQQEHGVRDARLERVGAPGLWPWLLDGAAGRIRLVQAWEATGGDFGLLLQPERPANPAPSPQIETTLALLTEERTLTHVVRLPATAAAAGIPIRLELPECGQILETALAPGWDALLGRDGKTVLLVPAVNRQPSADRPGEESTPVVLRVVQFFETRPEGRYGSEHVLVSCKPKPTAYSFVVRHAPNWIVSVDAAGWARQELPARAGSPSAEAIREIRLTAPASMPPLELAVVSRPFVSGWEAETRLVSFQNTLNGVTRFHIEGLIPAGMPIRVQLPAGTRVRSVEPELIAISTRVRQLARPGAGPILEIAPEVVASPSLDLRVHWSGMPAGPSLTRWQFDQPAVEGNPPGLHRIHVPRELLPAGAELRPETPAAEVTANDQGWTIDVRPTGQAPVSVRIGLAPWASPRVLWAERVTEPAGAEGLYRDRWTMWIWAPFGCRALFRFAGNADYAALVQGRLYPAVSQGAELTVALPPTWSLQRLQLISRTNLPAEKVLSRRLSGLFLDGVEQTGGHLWFLKGISSAPTGATLIDSVTAQKVRHERLGSVAREFAAILQGQSSLPLVSVYTQLRIAELLTAPRPIEAWTNLGLIFAGGIDGLGALEDRIQEELSQYYRVDERRAMIGEFYQPTGTELVVGMGMVARRSDRHHDQGVTSVRRLLAGPDRWWPAVAIACTVLLFAFGKFLLLRVGLVLLLLSAAAYLLENSQVTAAILLIGAIPAVFLGSVLAVAAHLRSDQEPEIVEP